MSWKTILASAVSAAVVSGLLWLALANAENTEHLRAIAHKHDTVFQLFVFLLLLIGFYLYFTPIKIDDE